jgi:hypothetical protein
MNPIRSDPTVECVLCVTRRPIQEVGAESGRRIAEKSEELDFRVFGAEVGIRFDIMPSNSAKISIEAANTVQVGSLNKSSVVVPIFSALN